MPIVNADVQALEQLQNGISRTVSPLTDALSDDFSEINKVRNDLVNAKQKADQRMQMTYNAYIKAENVLRKAIYEAKSNNTTIPDYYYKNVKGKKCSN